MRTIVNSYSKRFCNSTTTLRTILRRASGIDSDELRTSFLSFVLNHVQKRCPTGISDTFGNVAARKSLDVQRLDGNKAKPINDLSRQLVVKVVALVSRVFVQLADLAGQFFVLAAAAFAPGAPALQSAKFLFSGSEPSRVLDQLSCGQRGENLKSHVDPNGQLISDNGFNIGQLKLEDDVPASQVISLEDTRLDVGLVWQRAMLEQADQSDIVDVQLAIFQSQAVIIDEANRLVPSPTFSARIACLLSSFHTAKEATERFIQPAKGLLQRGKIAPGCILIKLANLLELVSLVIVVDPDLAALPRLAPFGKCIVVDSAMDLKHFVQELGLYATWIQAELVRQIHLATSLILNIARDRFGRDVTSCPDIVRTRPQARQTRFEHRIFLAQHAGRIAFELIDKVLDRICGRCSYEQVNVIGHNCQGQNVNLQCLCFLADQLLQAARNIWCQHGTAVLCAPYQVIVQIVDAARIFPVPHAVNCSILVGNCQIANIRKEDAASSVA